MNRQNLLKKAINLVVAAIFLAFLLYLSRPEKILVELGSVKLPLYMAGMIVFLATYLPSTERWKLIAENLGYNISFRNSFKILAISYALNRVLPGNTGDLIRSKIEERFHEVDLHSQMLGGVAAERFWDVASLTAIIILSGLLASSRLLEEYPWILILLVTGIAGATLALKTDLYIDRLKRYGGRAGDIVANIGEGYRQSSEIGAKRLGILSVSKWLLEAAAFFLFSISISAGITLPEAALVTSMMTLVSSLPITPSGIGPVDAVGTGMLVISGMTYSSAFSLVILQRTASIFLVAFVGGLVYVFNQ